MGRTPLVRVGVLVAAAVVWAVLPYVSSVEPTAVAADPPPSAVPKAELKTERQKGSYAFGYNVASNLRRSFGPDAVDVAAFLLGAFEGMTDKGASLAPADRDQALNLFRTELMGRQQKSAGQAAEMNKKKGEAFLAANKQKPGVKTLPSGIQYLVLKEGKGKQPKATDEVQVHYHGTLIDGTVFDSSVNRGEPATFRLDQVIAGWTESVQLMKEGSKWRVFIPSDLAYGRRGPGPIGPNATLIFEIELLQVK